MAANPIDEHTHEFEQLAGLSALDALDGEELARFTAHRARCERCQVMERLDREALSHLPLTAPEMDPSPDFKARLLERAAAEVAAHSAPPDTPLPRPVAERPSNVLAFRSRRPWLNALAAVFVLGLVSVGAYSYENQIVSRVELHGSAPGSAAVLVRRSGAAELEMRDVPEPGQGFVYEAWIIPSSPGSAPIAAGVTPSGNARVPLDRDPRGATVAITRERGRVDVPTPPILMSETVGT